VEKLSISQESTTWWLFNWSLVNWLLGVWWLEYSYSNDLRHINLPLWDSISSEWWEVDRARSYSLDRWIWSLESFYSQKLGDSLTLELWQLCEWRSKTTWSNEGWVVLSFGPECFKRSANFVMVAWFKLSVVLVAVLIVFVLGDPLRCCLHLVENGFSLPGIKSILITGESCLVKWEKLVAIDFLQLTEVIIRQLSLIFEPLLSFIDCPISLSFWNWEDWMIIWQSSDGLVVLPNRL